MSFTAVGVRAQYAPNGGGGTCAGNVTFTLTHSITDGTTTVPANPIVMTLNASGQISGNLDATDDTTTTPQGVYYQVEEQITGSPARFFTLSVSRAQAAGGIDLANVAAVPTGSGFLYELVPDAGTGSSYLAAVDDLSAIANANPTLGDVSLNTHKLTHVANGTVATDAAAFGQLPTTDQIDNPTAIGTAASPGATGKFSDVAHVHPGLGLLKAGNNLSDVANIGSSLYNLGVTTVTAVCVVSGNVSLSSPGGSFDGFSPLAGQTVLLVGQSVGSQNGLWTFNAATQPLTRPTFFPAGATIVTRAVVIASGVTYAGSVWTLHSSNSKTIDTDIQTWTQVGVSTSGGGGGGGGTPPGPPVMGFNKEAPWLYAAEALSTAGTSLGLTSVPIWRAYSGTTLNGSPNTSTNSYGIPVTTKTNWPNNGNGTIPTGASVPVVSIKIPIINQPAGNTYDYVYDLITGGTHSATIKSQLATFFANMPVGAIAIVWHEGEGKFTTANINPAASSGHWELIQMHATIYNIFKANAPAGCMYVQCLLGYTTYSGSSNYPASQWICSAHNGGVDLDGYTFDVYPNTSSDTPVGQLNNAIAQLLTGMGPTVPLFGITECNNNAMTGIGTAGYTMEGWIQACWNWLVGTGVNTLNGQAQPFCFIPYFNPAVSFSGQGNLGYPGDTAAGSSQATDTTLNNDLGAIYNASSLTLAAALGTGGGTPSSGGLDTNASDIQPVGLQAAGAVGLGADAGHVHPEYVFNVKAYGALGNGTTDDTTAIQAAVTAAAAATGGTVYFPPGTYFMSGVNVTAACTLLFDASFKCSAAPANAMFYVTGNDVLIVGNAPLVNGNSLAPSFIMTSGTSRVQINARMTTELFVNQAIRGSNDVGLKIGPFVNTSIYGAVSCNGLTRGEIAGVVHSGGGQAHGQPIIQAWAGDSSRVVQSVTIKGCRVDGLGQNANAATAITVTSAAVPLYDVNISDCHVTNWNQDALDFLNVIGGTISNVHTDSASVISVMGQHIAVSDCTARKSGGPGFAAGDPTVCTYVTPNDITFTNCHAYGCNQNGGSTSNWGFGIAGNTQTVTLNLTSASTTATGTAIPQNATGKPITGTGIPASTTVVSVASDGSSLVLSQAASSTQTAITATYTMTTDTVRFVGCTSTDDGSAKQGYGYGLHQYCSNVFIEDCDGRGNVTSAVFQGATGVSGFRARHLSGYNPIGSVTVAVPASGSATGVAPYDRYFYITAGTGGCTAVPSGVGAGPSIVIPATQVVPVFLPANNAMTVTYTNAPTWVVFGN